MSESSDTFAELRQSCEQAGRMAERCKLIDWAMQADADAKLAVLRYLKETEETK